ncbi:DUF6262 family protein [Nocardia sp. NPDC050412]|uniref:DUF6262 family protein n=1 Tax=unclassified Nocardia TaxID=2637762 RepID=UPI0037957E8E
MPADNSHLIVASARGRAAATRRHATAALRRMDAASSPITFGTLAREAGVSRSSLYNQPDLKAEIERLRVGRRPASATRTIPDRQRASDTSLLQRLEAATERNRRLEAENGEQWLPGDGTNAQEAQKFSATCLPRSSSTP